MSHAAFRVEALAFEKQFAYFFMTYEQVKGDLLAKLPKILLHSRTYLELRVHA